MLQNGNFSEGWETLPATVGWLRNQRPYHWQLEWIEPGQPLYDDSGTQSKGVPECVHKLSEQLPSNEQLGGRDALILDGEATFKIFSFGAPFGATLSQTVTGLKPGSQATLTVPIQVHMRNETDAYGAESGVWVNDEGSWVNGFDMGDRQWYRHIVTFTVPDSGEAEIVIRVKSKWARGKDFFFDGITLDAQVDEGTPDDDGEGTGDEGNSGESVQGTVYVQVPAGIELKVNQNSQSNVVEINVPSGVTVTQV